MSVFLLNGKWVVDYWPNSCKGKHIRITLPETAKTKDKALFIEKELRKN
jgi:hypothetical protein